MLKLCTVSNLVRLRAAVMGQQHRFASVFGLELSYYALSGLMAQGLATTPQEEDGLRQPQQSICGGRLNLSCLLDVGVNVIATDMLHFGLVDNKMP